MIDTLILGKSNAYGLTRDAEILQAALARVGVAADFATVGERTLWNRITRKKRARRIIHLERAHASWFGAADEHWLIPNQERFPRRHLGRLRKIDRVLAKTAHAEGIFRDLGCATTRIGFSSPDRRDLSIMPDTDRFFHLAGGSTLKGTEDILAAWSRHPEWPELTLVQKTANAASALPTNVRLLSGYLDDAELRSLQNGCGVHLCPSRSEGWGHHIVEALSVGAVVLATDAPPMNELVTAECGILLPVARSESRHLGTNYFISATGIEAAVESVIRMPLAQKRALGEAARQRYQEIDRSFNEAIQALVAT